MEKLSEELEKTIIDEYTNTEIKSKEIENKYNLNRHYFLKLLKKYNILLKDHRIKLNENYFETINSSSKAYYLGFIAGDGSLRYNKVHNAYTLTISLHTKDIDILEKFKKDLDSEHKINTIQRLDKRFNVMRDNCYISISNNKLCTDLIKNGIKIEKSSDLSIPSCITDELMPHFIRGLSDSDGGWHFKSNDATWGFVSSILSFSEEVKKIIMKNCNLDFIHSYPNAKNEEKITCWRFQWGGNIQCKRIYDYLYSNGGPWLDRKYKLSTDYFNNVEITCPDMKYIRSLKMEHSYSKYMNNVCRCDICKLCNRIYGRYSRLGIHLVTTFITEMSIKHLDDYKKVTKSNQFYKIIDDEIRIRKLTERIETNTNFDSKSFGNRKKTKKKENESLKERGRILMEIKELPKPKEPSYLNQLLGFKS